MEDIIQNLSTEQTTLGKSITQLFDNFKKERVERRTVEATQAYQSKLNDYWTKFTANHEQLAELLSQHEGHPYMKQDFNKQVREAYDLFSAKITERLKEITSKASSFRREEDDQGESEASSEILKCKRRLKAAISSLDRIIDTIERETKTPQSKAYYVQKLTSIKQYWEQITSLHGQLIAELDNNSLEEMIYADIEDRFHSTAIKLQEKLDELATTGDVKVKLPEIVLPIFDGSYTKWMQFKDLFIQLIHNRPLGSAEKMYYLKANVTGEPSRLIKHLQATGDNYSLAWRILVDRYDNPRSIMTSLLNDLLSQAALTSPSSSGIKRIHDTTKECLLILQNMDIRVREWSPILLHLLLQKLDKESRVLYEQSLKSSRELQDIDDFISFLETRFQMLEAVQSKTDKKSSALSASVVKNRCPVCNMGHKVFKCDKILYAPLETRIQIVKQHKLCQNCLRTGHNSNRCPSRGCLKCNGRHNTLLHNPKHAKKQTDVSPPNVHSTNSSSQRLPANSVGQYSNEISGKDLLNNPSLPSTSKNITLNASSDSQVLLATAVVKVIGASGNSQLCRVLLDSGSQVNFIRESMVQLLGLRRNKINIPINGIGGTETMGNYEVTLTVQSRINNYSANITAVILSKISDYLPRTYIKTTNWNIPTNICLADPAFFKPQAIDMLLGAELYFEFLKEGKIKLDNNLPVLQNTQFGWVLSGRVAEVPSTSYSSHIATQPSLTALDKQLQQFWELEQHDSPSNYRSKEEIDCEDHFQNTFERSSSGRYIVRLPFREQPSSLGNSLEMATKRFYALERKLEKNPTLRTQYCDFMKEYEMLGHMRPIARELVPSSHYYLPHHCVFKTDSSTTKLRVVFDASAKTTSGKSLNDILMVGPTVQPDLFSILINFRLHKYVLTADICKMYRQIDLHPADRSFQLILWRENKSKPLQTYQLNTVTYGTATAPYLATRCLNQLALAEYDTYPEAANVIFNNTYVDDILTGANSRQTLLKVKDDLIRLLNSGGFELRKFCANHSDLLHGIPETHKEKMLLFNNTEVTKTLGLIWQPREDVFQYQSGTSKSEILTKRTVLSDVARIFDPLGLIGPVTVLGKLFVQELWKAKTSWDNELPREYQKKWNKFKMGLSELNELKIPRHVLLSNSTDIQLHAFSDSSESAYGACCYIRSVDDYGQIRVRLVCAKSKLAPLKTTTLARLELCAALLMAELVQRVLQCMKISFSRITYYTDSTIVLSWIASPSYSWSTFVGNRVEKIQQLTQPYQWKHIVGTQNPADIISRGMMPHALSQSPLWFKGPKFLSEIEENWPASSFKPPEHIPETRAQKSVLSATAKETKYVDIITPINHSNSFLKLQRIFAYCLRFVENCKSARKHRRTGNLTIQEIDKALASIIKNVQRTTFLREHKLLKRDGTLESNDPLQKLAPYVDNENDIIRVGGRLNLSELGPDAKNQILLPKSHKFSELLLSYLHKKHMHAGPQTLVAILREKYWVLDAKTLARKTVHRCIRCFRSKPKIANQIMGNLPKERVTPSMPFHTTGIDFCGPIIIHYKQRGRSPTKAYIAVFVCFATKAVHLELVSDLSTEAFLNALKRFIARRGSCATIFCDNATNFLGARTKLKELKDLLTSEDLQSSLSKLCNETHIEWKPIPPRSPHFGGLWEAAVKSAKKHLLRQVGNACLTYEELHTVIVQIEAILNSRPLIPLSSDPNDLEALTPGHFLTGRPLTSIAEPDLSDENINNLTRYKRIQHIKQNFWKRWSTEYLQELQTRYKWKGESPNIEPGNLVLVKDANLPPMKWPLGRVVETFDGLDGLTRVVNVKTSSGVYKRSIHNLCPLPKEIYLDEKEGNVPSPDKEPNTEQLTCLVGLNQNPNTNIETASGEPAPKKKRLKRPNHPLRGRFLPINSSWTGSSSLDARHSRLSTSKGTSDVKGGISASAAFKVLMLTSLVLPLYGLPQQAPVEITPFSHHPGIFFEQLGQTQFINSEWSILAFYNLTNYWKELKGIQGCIKNLEALCNNTILRKNHCSETLYQFQHEVTQIEEANEILHKSGGNYRILRKRSPFDIVGNVANKVFGILDSSYAKFIEGEIEKGQANHNYLINLFKNQTSILEATTNIIKRRDEAIQQQFDAIHDYMAAYSKFIKNVQQEQEAMNSFSTLSTLTTLVIQNYHRVQDALLTVLTDAHHNRISPLLITPTQLREQVTLIKEHIPSTLSLPGNDKEGVLFIYNLMKVGVKATESYILCDIRIPLHLNEHFQLFKLIPVPIPMENKLVLIRPATEYLIVSLSRERYYPLMQQELDKCKQLDAEGYLCNQNHPIYNLKANVSQCEMDLFNHRQSSPSRCQFEISNSSNLWIQLHTSNNWLYYMDHEQTFNILCGTAVLIKSINGSGTLRLRPDCAIRQATMTITGHGRYKGKTMSSFIPRVNISSFSNQHLITTHQEQPDTLPNVPLPTNESELEELISKINALKGAESFRGEITAHDIHHYSISYLILTSLICGIILYGFIKWRKSKRTSQKTPEIKPIYSKTPAPPRRKAQPTDQDFVLQSNPRGQDVQ